LPEPVGIPESEIIRTLAGLQALGEIMNVPPAQLRAVLDKAEAELRVKP